MMTDAAPDTEREPAVARRRTSVSGTHAIPRRRRVLVFRGPSMESLYASAEACGAVASALVMLDRITHRPCVPAHVRAAVPDLAGALALAVSERDRLYDAARDRATPASP